MTDDGTGDCHQIPFGGAQVQHGACLNGSRWPCNRNQDMTDMTEISSKAEVLRKLSYLAPATTQMLDNTAVLRTPP
jgi:hypothetical protein